MKCEQYQDLFTDWINNQLNPSEKEQLEQHITGCEGCAEELQAMHNIWTMMGEVPAPEPSAHMKVKFSTMLNTYKESVADERGSWGNIKTQFGKLWQQQPRWPFAYNIALVLICFGTGYWFLKINKSDEQSQKLQTLTSQVHELKQTMMLALLDNPSASERMKGVSYTSEIKNADKQVIDALLATLNSDPNVNVRLSTLDALTNLANHPEVRQGLIESITEQESPLMQSAIADVMLKLQEKRSVGSFKELLKQKHLDQGVRSKIRETINRLI